MVRIYVITLIIALMGCSKEEGDPVGREYTVTFDVAGGSPAPAPVQVVAGGKIAEPAGETREGRADLRRLVHRLGREV